MKLSKRMFAAIGGYYQLEDFAEEVRQLEAKNERLRKILCDILPYARENLGRDQYLIKKAEENLRDEDESSVAASDEA